MQLLFDTREHEPEERFDRWVDEAQRLFFPLTGTRLADGPFAVRVEGGTAGAVSAYRLAGDGNRCLRTWRDVGRHDPEQISLHLVRRGWCHFTQGDRSERVGPGEMASFDTSRPMQLDAGPGFELALFVLPKQLLGGAADRICARAAERVGGGGMGGPVRAFLTHLADDFENATAETTELADSVAALMRVLYQEPSAPGLTARRPIAVGLLRQVQDHVDRHLADTTLGPEAIARANTISTRYLHKLFEMEGVTVSSWIRRRRLEGLRRDLLDPSLATWTISQLAERWGLPDAAVRSRAFRRAYGCSPRELRESRLRPR